MKLYLKGTIYFGGFHFVSWIIRKDDTVWFHDGQMGSECIYDKRLEDFSNSDLKICGQRTVSIVIYCMILINSTPYRDRDMPDKNLHLSVGGMTRDKV